MVLPKTLSMEEHKNQSDASKSILPAAKGNTASGTNLFRESWVLEQRQSGSGGRRMLMNTTRGAWTLPRMLPGSGKTSQLWPKRLKKTGRSGPKFRKRRPMFRKKRPKAVNLSMSEVALPLFGGSCCPPLVIFPPSSNPCHTQ